MGEIDPRLVAVRISDRAPDGLDTLAYGTAGYYTIDGVPRIRLEWAWDTAGLAGEQTLRVELDPDDAITEGDEDPTNNVVYVTAELQPAEERHPVEAAAAWSTTSTECCVVHYLTSTAAERDLANLAAMVQSAVTWTTEELDADLTRRLDVYFVDRVIGQGGYAQRALALSYLDRRYAGYDLETVIRHEAVHVVDVRMMDDPPPAMLREGLAVWVAGGHFQPEPIPERAAALVELGLYVPLDQLADDFYLLQHEAGYLEAAALVSYLIETYGWDGFLEFYGAFEDPSGLPSAVLDEVLLSTFDVGLTETEDGFREWLRAYPPEPKEVLNLQTTIRLFETVRLYQQAYEPGAYFLTGWLVDPVEAESLGVVADLVRHPREVENVALEAMLLTASNSLTDERLGTANAYLSRVEDALLRGEWDSVAEDYAAIVEAVAEAGYEVQSLELAGPTARVQSIADWPELVELSVIRTLAGWVVRD
jgi:hypothetical protein